VGTKNKDTKMKDIVRRIAAGESLMDSNVVLVSPELAAEWLKKNNTGENRAVSQEVIANYAMDMKNNKWDLTHQGICFGEDGALVDGQHRLHAIVMAGVTVAMMVTRTSAVKGPRDAIIDQQRRRAPTYLLGGTYTREQSTIGSVLGQLVLSHTAYATIPNVKEILIALGPSVELVSAIPQKSPMRLSAVRSALVLRHAIDDEDYAIEQYRIFGSVETDGLTPRVKAFYKECVGNKIDTRSGGARLQLVSRAFFVFHPEGRTRKISTTPRSGMLLETRKQARAILESKGCPPFWFTRLRDQGDSEEEPPTESNEA